MRLLVSLVILTIGMVLQPVLAASGRYDVVAHRGGAQLDVTARLGPLKTLQISVNDGAEPYVEHVQIHTTKGWIALAPGQNCWMLPSWARHGCWIRYRYNVARAAAHSHDLALPSRHDTAYHICPESFLLRSWDRSSGLVRFTVHTFGMTRFVTGAQPVAPNVYQLRTADLDLGPDAAFGPLKVIPIDVPGARLRLAFLSGSLPVKDEDLLRWTRQRTLEVARFFQRFPKGTGLVLMLPTSADETCAHARGGGGWSVFMAVGKHQSPQAFRRDTVLTHEMVHVCTPGMHTAQHWMEEGIATYLERIIPAQSGQVGAVDVWRDLMNDLPQGQCRDGGLNRAESEDQTYYGGALFWLLADLKIRDVTNGERSLRDALLAFNRAGGNITSLWPAQHLLRVGDDAIGAPVLHHLYARMATKRYKANLPRLWRKLGVVRDGKSVRFVRSAPLSHIRRSVTHPSHVAAHPAGIHPAHTVSSGAIPGWITHSLDVIEVVGP